MSRFHGQVQSATVTNIAAIFMQVALLRGVCDIDTEPFFLKRFSNGLDSHCCCADKD